MSLAAPSSRSCHHNLFGSVPTPNPTSFQIQSHQPACTRLAALGRHIMTLLWFPAHSPPPSAVPRWNTGSCSCASCSPLNSIVTDLQVQSTLVPLLTIHKDTTTTLKHARVIKRSNVVPSAGRATSRCRLSFSIWTYSTTPHEVSVLSAGNALSSSLDDEELLLFLWCGTTQPSPAPGLGLPSVFSLQVYVLEHGRGYASLTVACITPFHPPRLQHRCHFHNTILPRRN